MSGEQAPIDEPRDLIGEVLANRYRIEQRLGEGAMGTVYKARHIKVGRPFAVKVLHKRLLEDTKTLQRFDRDAQLAGRLRHPNLVGVVDVGETTDGFRYMVMDFAEGSDLATLLGEAPMPAERVIHLTRQMLEGLYHAHEAGLIHRDFKPENVIIEKNDHGVEVPRIVDFGIAILREGGDSANADGRLTTNGLVLGTPHYMAPEQAVADPIDHRIDLFALGIVIYEMLSGKLPFDGSGAEIARANLLLDPPLIAQRVPYLEVDPLVEAFARRLMAKKRELRPATAKAARELLDLIVDDPASAAVALGVPLSSTRTPAVTQPVRPTTDPPAPPIALEAPAYPTPPPVAEPVEPVRGQQDIHTAATDPLDYARPRGTRTLMFGALALVGVGAIITVIVLSGGSNKQPEPVVQATVDRPPAQDPPKQTPPVQEPPAKDPPKDPVIDPPAKDPPVKDPPPVDTPKQTPKQPPKQPKQPPKEPVVVKDSGSATVQPEPRPAPTGTIDAKSLYALYVSVGNEIAAVVKKKGADAVSDINIAYRRIQIQNAMADESKRDETGKLLGSLRRQLGPLK